LLSNLGVAMGHKRNAVTARKFREAPRTPNYHERRAGFPVNPDISISLDFYFLPRHSAPERELYTFGYKVEIKNTGAITVYLRNRNWMIASGGGVRYDVFAPSVGGEELIEIRPGKTVIYHSAVPLNSPHGNTFRGYFKGFDAKGRRFVTRESETIEFDAPEDAIEQCAPYLATTSFADLVGHDLKAFQTLLRGDDPSGGIIDTRDLIDLTPAVRLEFERLLLLRMMCQFREHQLRLDDIHPSFPHHIDVLDMVFLAGQFGPGIRIEKRPAKQERKPSEETREPYCVVVSIADYRKKRETTVENSEVNDHNGTRLRITERQDEGAVDALRNAYLKSLGITKKVSEEKAAQIDALVKAEIERTAAPRLTEAELAAFMEHAKSKPWKADGKVAAFEHIETTFAAWLGRGLMLEHVRKAQENLAAAYSSEVSRDPTKRVQGLGTRPHTRHSKKPVNPDAPKVPRTKWIPAADLLPEQAALGLEQEAARKRNAYVPRRQSVKSPLEI